MVREHAGKFADSVGSNLEGNTCGMADVVASDDSFRRLRAEIG